MVKYGNLIQNGDFEAGNVDLWTVLGTEVASNDATPSIETGTVFEGSYSMKLTSTGAGLNLRGYNKTFRLAEEYEGLMYNVRLNRGTATATLISFGLYEDTGKVVGVYQPGIVLETGWQIMRGIVPVNNLLPVTKIFLGMLAGASGYVNYVDNVFLSPIKSLQGVSYTHRVLHGVKTSSFDYYTLITVPRSFRASVWLNISGTGGTLPTLDVTLWTLDLVNRYKIEHTAFPQITANGDYYFRAESNAGGQPIFEYRIGGTSPTFDIKNSFSFTVI